MTYPAFHLPGVAHPPTTVWSYGRGDDPVQLRVPQLTPALLAEQIQALRAARDRHLAERPVRHIVEIIDAVAARLLDPADALRQAAEHALPPVTGASPPMVARVLDRMAADWRAPRLWELLRSELGDPEVLDGFRPRRGSRGRSQAHGPELAVHVFSGNVPGVNVTSLVRAMLVKAASLGKSAAGEPLLAALFARGIAEVDPDLGRCLAVTYWPGGDTEMERTALAAADAVIVYGGRNTVSAIRAQTPPTARFLGYGHKLSFGVVAREALSAAEAPALAQRAALDVATFDQHGCTSPHLFYVEEDGELAPAEWARLLADALRRLQDELPRGALSPGEAAAIRQLRGEAEFAQIAGRGVELHASPETTAWTVVFDPEPRFEASCLNRTVRVKPVPSLDAVLPLVQPVAAVLQTVGMAGPDHRVEPLAAGLGRLGASRIAPLGRMSWPPPDWHHDGQPPLAPLLRWSDWEGAGG